MSFITPTDPVTNLIDDIGDKIKWFPDGLLLRYNKESENFECVYNQENDRFTEAIDPVTALDMAEEMRCIMCNSTNTTREEFSGTQNDYQPFYIDNIICHDCNHVESD